MSYPDPYAQPVRPPNQATTIVIRPTPQTSGIRIAMGIIALLIALVLGLLVLLVIGVETGPIPFLLGFIAATIPVPLYVMLVLWIDRYEAEPLWMLAAAFLWGALIAAFFSFLLNTIAGVIVAVIADNPDTGEVFSTVISAPIVEETAKAIILIIFFIWWRDEFDGVIDGIVYAALVGLGFAMTENILYYGKAAMGGGTTLTVTFFIRGALAPFSHPLFTGLTGIGLGLARQSRNSALKILAPFGGLLMAVFLHWLWNASATFGGGGGFLVIYVIVMVPAFTIMLIVILVALSREGKVVRQFLLSDLERGFLTRDEYDQLGSVFRRMGSSYNAFSTGGMRSWRNRMKLNQLASELAFHRSRVSRGLHSSKDNIQDLEAAYLHSLQTLLDESRMASR